jgi:hypothetical protein
MTLSTKLETLRASLSCCTYRGDQHSDILIEEHDKLAKLKKVTLTASNGDWFSFDPDKGRGKKALMSPLLAVGAAYEHHRACDCVVLIQHDNRLITLYIDLKSNNPRGYTNQFKSTRQFVHYAIGLLEEFHGYSFASRDERFIVLYGGKPALINKTTTVPKLERIGDTKPDQPYKRQVPNSYRLYIKEFLG